MHRVAVQEAASRWLLYHYAVLSFRRLIIYKPAAATQSVAFSPLTFYFLPYPLHHFNSLNLRRITSCTGTFSILLSSQEIMSR